MRRTAGGRRLEEGKFWCSRRLVKEAWRKVEAGFALLPDEDFEKFIQGVKPLWRLTLPEDFRHKLQDLAITVGRKYVEDGLDGKTLIAACESYAPTIAKYLELGEWSADTVRKWIDCLLLPAVAVYALSRLAESTQSLEPKIRELLAKAQKVEKTDPEHAKLIRAEADYLCKKFPRGFVPNPRKIGRPNLNLWRAKALDLLFQDGAPISQMAKALGQDAASLRRRRKLSRSKIAEALRPPVARRIADPKR
jgi:transposase-like protein